MFGYNERFDLMAQEPSTEISLELPEELYEAAKQRATAENRSLNDVVVEALRELLRGIYL
ncbi:MAG TPA: hypothetical protein VN519_10140 [Bryobacteraceae bacterium]|nr:hypothetical protein [Bryobacteraceae bacterium]